MLIVDINAHFHTKILTKYELTEFQHFLTDSRTFRQKFTEVQNKYNPHNKTLKISLAAGMNETQFLSTIASKSAYCTRTS